MVLRGELATSSQNTPPGQATFVLVSHPLTTKWKIFSARAKSDG